MASYLFYNYYVFFFYFHALFGQKEFSDCYVKGILFVETRTYVFFLFIFIINRSDELLALFF